MFTDRLQFQETKLKNGITIYYRNEPVAYTRICLTVPVGTIHNIRPIIPGTAHFLEHLIYEQTNISGNNSFSRRVGLYGGWVNAYTRTYETSFDLSIPTRHLTAVLPDFFQLIFQPQFTDEDVAIHRGIIKNERHRDEPWYPEADEHNHYLSTQWKQSVNYPIEQIFGSDTDLNQITADYLKRFHRHYLDPRIRVVAAGSGDIESLVSQLEDLSVSQHNLTERFQLDSWKHREFHTKGFADLNQYEYRIGGFIQPQLTPELTRAANFIQSYLTNSVHGPLYQWLREEEGWAYETTFYSSSARWIYDWSLYLPVDSYEQVAAIRKELRPRIESALRDKVRINKEVDRMMAILEAYPYEAVDSIVEEFEDIYNTYGRPIDQTTWRQYVEYCRDPDWLWRVYGYVYDPVKVGEVCLTPLDAAE